MKHKIDYSKVLNLDLEELKKNFSFLYLQRKKIIETILIKRETINRCKFWMGCAGINFFKKCKTIHGKISPTYIEHGVPHIVSLREGRQVVKWMSQQPEFDKFTILELSNLWIQFIEHAIKD